VGIVSHVDFVLNINKNKIGAFVHFESFYDSDKALSFQDSVKKIVDDPVNTLNQFKFQYTKDGRYWPILPNKGCDPTKVHPDFKNLTGEDVSKFFKSQLINKKQAYEIAKTKEPEKTQEPEKALVKEPEKTQEPEKALVKEPEKTQEPEKALVKEKAMVKEKWSDWSDEEPEKALQNEDSATFAEIVKKDTNVSEPPRFSGKMTTLSKTKSNQPTKFASATIGKTKGV